MINTIQKINQHNYLMLKPKRYIKQQYKMKAFYIEIQALIKRLYIQVYRRPSTLVSGIIQPLLWLLLFGALFQNAPVGLLTSNTKYGQFLSPGIIIFTAFTGSINAGLPLMFDREFGFLNRLLTSPIISRDSLLISSIIFIATITMFQTIIITIFSLLLFNSITNITNLFMVFFIIFLITISIASISICLAFILPGHIEFLAFILIINLPTLFSSTALAPLSFMPYWLQIIASINPLTHAIESIRYICTANHLIHNTQIIQTTWFNLSLNKNICILLIINIISIISVRKIISHKCE
uniref:ABC-2 type transporter n=1 Tax=Schimmelmannia schousboei TaxID=173468 RepID=A0A1C9C8Y9_9FLOR|nr:ABC-2 type transporter [Schimmelmannia schousboei]AOM64853.1 ABC-2 type transporter [Schimmelmannia schousboei]